MTTTRFTFTQGLVAKLAFPLLAALLLAGCNNADPYGDATVSGNVLGPADVNPLDANQEAITQVALFAGKPVTGLYYVCADVHGTRDTTNRTSSTAADGSTVVTQVPVAICGNDATSVSLYLGKVEPIHNDKNFVQLGKLVLPIFTPVGSDGKRRYCVDAEACGDDYGGISKTKFLFHYSLTDTQSGPARLDVSGSFDASGNCKAGKQSACEVVYAAALLQALDENKGMGDEISIPAAANNYLADPANAAAIGFAGLTLDKPSYGAFKSAWDAFVNHVCQSGTVCNGLLPFSGTLLSDIEAPVSAGSARLQSGNYRMNYTGLLSGYGGYYSGQILKDLVISDPSFSANFMAYPDGYMVGIGSAAQLKGACPNKPSGAATAEEISNYLICVVLAVSDENYVLATSNQLNAYADLGLDGQIQNLQLVSLAAPPAGNGVDLTLVGRVIHGFLYDGRVPPSAPTRPNDFNLDYINNTASSGNYVLADSEKGSIWGDFFDIALPPAPTSGTVSVDANGNPTPFPIRLSKVGSVQNTPLDSAVLQALSGKYYRIKLMRFCTETETCATSIPVDEIGAEASDNYPDSVCPMGEACDPAFKPTQETPMATHLNSGVTEVNLRFDVWDNVSDSLNITLLDDNCAPVQDGNFNPMRVGTVIATPATNADVSATTADISLLFVPPDLASVNVTPFLGVTLTGRIDLSLPGSWPIYRLGDDNFNAGIRARWQSAGYQATLFFEDNNVESPSDYNNLTDVGIQQMPFALTSGAVVGERLTDTGSCQPAP